MPHIKKTTISLLLVLTGTTACSSTAIQLTEPRVPTDRFQAMAQGRPASPLPPSINEQTSKGIARDQLRMYLAGIVDSGEGIYWCVQKTGLPPHELDTLLIRHVENQAKAQQAAKPGSPVQLVTEKLKTDFPCNP